jgi:hypothetical protein
MSNYLKIQSKQPDLNPCPIHQNHINFYQSNQIQQEVCENFHDFVIFILYMLKISKSKN